MEEVERREEPKLRMQARIVKIGKGGGFQMYRWMYGHTE
jgi:hypothetical protein